MKPWEEGHNDGFNDAVLGRGSKIQEVPNSLLVTSIHDRKTKLAYAKGYLAGYEKGKKECEDFVKIICGDPQKKLREGFFDAVRAKRSGESLKIEEEIKEEEEDYKRGYSVGRQQNIVF